MRPKLSAWSIHACQDATVLPASRFTCFILLSMKSMIHLTRIAGLCVVFFGAVNLTAQTNLVVAADGSGQFTNVQAAIMSVPSGNRANPVLIHIKPGIYKELIYVQREKRSEE